MLGRGALELVHVHGVVAVGRVHPHHLRLRENATVNILPAIRSPQGVNRHLDQQITTFDGKRAVTYCR